MEQTVQPEQTPAIPIEAYQLVEEYQLGLPLALYNMRPLVLRLFKWHSRIMLIGGLFLFLGGLTIFLIHWYQLLLLSSQHPTDPYRALDVEAQISHLQNQFIEDLIPVILGFIYSVGWVVQKRLVDGMLPAYVLVGTQGLLVVRPKKVDLTRWDEVTCFLQLPSMSKRKSYMLGRINRKSLTLSNAFENVEGLADLIRQQIKPSLR